jgi:hypothetical protein
MSEANTQKLVRSCLHAHHAYCSMLLSCLDINAMACAAQPAARLPLPDETLPPLRPSGEAKCGELQGREAAVGEVPSLAGAPGDVSMPLSLARRRATVGLATACCLHVLAVLSRMMCCNSGTPGVGVRPLGTRGLPRMEGGDAEPPTDTRCAFCPSLVLLPADDRSCATSWTPFVGVLGRLTPLPLGWGAAAFAAAAAWAGHVPSAEDAPEGG